MQGISNKKTKFGMQALGYSLLVVGYSKIEDEKGNVLTHSKEYI
jgi:hypothetical protein